MHHTVCHTVHRCVCISLEAANDTDVLLALSYVVSSASWTPQYDLRVFSNDKTMKASNISNHLCLCVLTLLIRRGL